MQAVLNVVPGVLLCSGLGLAGNMLADGLGIGLPGPVIGLLAYAAWLFSGRGIGWSFAGAALLVRWIGAMIVPALVGLGAYGQLLTAAALPLLLVLVASTLITAFATAGLYRLAGGQL